MNSNHDIMNLLRGRLVVSCQAPVGDPFAKRPARVVRAGGGYGRSSRNSDGGPGCSEGDQGCYVCARDRDSKRVMADRHIMITPSDEDARELVAAGADIIAIDCTARGQRQRGARAHWLDSFAMHLPVWADIATMDEAIAAANAGADAVLSTLRGYTDDTANVPGFEASFIAALARAVRVPVIAEGRINSEQGCAAPWPRAPLPWSLGTAITRPEEITRRFAESMGTRTPWAARHIIGIDLGGTGIKSGISGGDGRLLFHP